MRDSILDYVGKTPLVRLRRLVDGVTAEVRGKAEAQNPGGSIRDRVGIAMIEEAERRGWLSKSSTIIEATLRFLRATRLFRLAESLGGVESLVCHPTSMTHASIPAEVRQARGVDDGLVRLSVGIEDPEDLRRDLANALDAAH